MIAQPNFKIPPWVPKSVQDEATMLLDKTSDEKARAVLKRLLTHSKMRRVWRELTKQKRDLSTYKPTGGFYEQESPPRKFLGITYGSNNLASFFSSAYSLAVDPVFVMTREKVLERLESLNNATKQLEKLAVQFKHWHNDSEVSGQFDTHMWASTLPKGNTLYVPENLRFVHRWTDLNQVADELGNFALFFDFLTGMVKPEGRSPVVQRRTARDDVRAYVIKLAGLSKDYFGTSLYSVVATTASVALKKKVSPDFVKRGIQRRS